MEKIIAKSFNEKVNMILEDDVQREELYKTMRNYQQSHDVSQLIDDLKLVLNEPNLLELYDDIRTLIPPKHQIEYSRLAPKVPSSHLRIIRLTRVANESLGFAVRGGLEHGIGVFVSHVVPGSQAESQGLRVGDELVRVNGFTIKQAVHQEVLNLIKTKSELILKVKNVGMLPVKDNDNERVTWRYLEYTENVDSGKTLQAVLDGDRPKSKLEEAKIFICLPVGATLGCSIFSGSAPLEGIFIKSVRPDSYAMEAGLEVGDQILQVNGTNFSNISHSEAIVALKGSRYLNFIVRKGAGRDLFKPNSGPELGEDPPHYGVNPRMPLDRNRATRSSHFDSKQKDSNFSDMIYGSQDEIRLPKQQDLIQQAIIVMEQKEAAKAKPPNSVPAEVQVHSTQDGRTPDSPPKPRTNSLSENLVQSVRPLPNTYSKVTKPSQSNMNIHKTNSPHTSRDRKEPDVETVSQKSLHSKPIYMSTDDNASFRIQKPVLLHPTRRNSQDPIYSSVNNDYEEISINEDNFNPNRLFTNEQIAGRIVKLISMKKGESDDLGIVIEANASKDHPGIVISEIYEGGAFHKNGEMDVGDEILMVDGVHFLGKSLDDAKTALQKSYASSPKIPMQIVIAKALHKNEKGPDVLPRPDYYDEPLPTSNLDDYLWEENRAFKGQETIPITII